MKKYVFLTALVMFWTVAGVTQSAAETGGPQGNPDAGRRDGHKLQEKFPEHKAKVLKNIAERLARLQHVQSCVQAAADHKALKACRQQEK
ncbi:MAG: hypothetical protein H7833_18040 [Magnetococcus sp. DMHC-1]|nr:hypothetical protein [Magnetococcales bacterium]